jgi:hypothetical protein
MKNATPDLEDTLRCFYAVTLNEGDAVSASMGRMRFARVCGCQRDVMPFSILTVLQRARTSARIPPKCAVLHSLECLFTCRLRRLLKVFVEHFGVGW